MRCRNDALVFPSENENIAPQDWPDVSLSNDGRWLLVEVNQGWTRTDLYLKDFSVSESKFQCLTVGENCLYNARTLDGQLYITTNDGAPRFRVFKASCQRRSVPTGGKLFRGVPRGD